MTRDDGTPFPGVYHLDLSKPAPTDYIKKSAAFIQKGDQTDFYNIYAVERFGGRTYIKVQYLDGSDGLLDFEDTHILEFIPRR